MAGIETQIAERWAIVGGGVLGMATALRLLELGRDVTLYEGLDVLGGMASAWRVGDVTWDRHYHVTLLSDSRTRALYADAGITDDEIFFVETRNGYFGPDRTLRPFSGPIDFLKLPDLRMIDKLRLGGTIVLGAAVRDGRRMERIEVDRWLRRWSGRTAFESFWKPLLRAKLGNSWPRASAAFIWATIQRLFAARRSGLERELFGYVAGGWGTVCDRVHGRLVERGATVRLSTRVASITREADGLRVTDGDGGSETFDRVLVTTGSHLAAKLCPDLLQAERERLERVEYLGIVCPSLVLSRPLGGYYLTYITDEDSPFTAVVEMTALVDPAQTGGHTLVYLPKYTDESDPLFAASDGEVIERFWSYLVGMYPDLSRDDLVAARVSKVRQVFAVPSLHFSDDAPSVGTSVPGLYLAGSAHLPFSTLNVDDTLSLVDEVLAAAGLGVPH